MRLDGVCNFFSKPHKKRGLPLFLNSLVFKNPFNFAVKTGDPDHPVSEYNAKSQHVVKIDYVTGSAAQVATDKKAWKVKSSDGKKFYLVQRVNGKFSCTCTGFEFRKDCKHIGAVSKR